MSHSSGITVSQGLKDAFGNAVSSEKVRLLKVQITPEPEELVATGDKPAKGSYEDDLSLVPALLEEKSPCFILFRLDPPTRNQWVLLCYVPDKAKVKEKMIYASTRANLKQQLGGSFFVDEVFGTVAADFSATGYRQHVASKKMDAPLTEQEQIKKNELESGEIYSGGASTYVHGVTFPVDKAVTEAVKKLVNGSLTYVQIAIDVDKEVIILDRSSNINLDGLRKEIPLDQPRFHLFAYKHKYEGQSVSSIVFLYSCPDGSKGTKSAPVKMRMLYSSSKANVGNIITPVGGKVDAKLEINSAEDIIEDELVAYLHPQVEEKAAAFSKPTRAGQGARKLIRSPKT